MLANKNFLPDDDQSEFEVGFRAAEGTSLEATEIIANRIAARVRQLPEVEFTLVTRRRRPGADAEPGLGLRPAEAGRRADPRPVRGHERGARSSILPSVAVEQAADRRSSGRDVRRRRQPERRDPVHDQRSRSRRRSNSSAAAVAEPRARQAAGLVDVDTSLNVGKPELSVHIDRLKAADLGVQMSDAAEALRLLVGGDQVTTYNEGGRAVRSPRPRRRRQPRRRRRRSAGSRSRRPRSAACRWRTSRA